MWIHNSNEMRSPIVKKILEEMDRDPWYVKLRRWFRLQRWVMVCKTRKYWEKMKIVDIEFIWIVGFGFVPQDKWTFVVILPFVILTIEKNEKHDRTDEIHFL